jgi:transcriptional regulator with XRE-family HTH domain
LDTPGKLVREVRQRHGLTQVQLGRLMGIASNHIARLERGEVTPSDQFLAHLELLDRILTVDPRWRVTRLVQDGWLDHQPGRPRTLKVVRSM